MTEIMFIRANGIVNMSRFFARSGFFISFNMILCVLPFTTVFAASNLPSTTSEQLQSSAVSTQTMSIQVLITHAQDAQKKAESDPNQKNQDIALKLWKEAANRGNAFASYKLGACYLNLSCMGFDSKSAVPWLQKSASLGNAAAMAALSSLYLFGRNAPEPNGGLVPI